ncbi:Adenylate cyclase [Minicystis rosea]|nr:Adenylate cyclase [Minicystis rosea]
MDTGEIVADRFEIEHLAGAGGMGEVFRARDRWTGDAVALKVQSGPPEAQDQERFEREAVALRALDHPNVVRYVAHGSLPSGARWLAMEWIEGEDLGVRLRRGPLPLDEARRLGRRVAEALGAAHARGIVHRDLKPSNLVLPDGDVDRIKVIDFGIARLAWATRATRTGVAVGTPGYMAPEQAQGLGTLDARADVFSLGAILFECITGQPAFAGDSVMALLVKILFEEAPRLAHVMPDAPAALDRLIARMLAKAPDDRPEGGAEVASALADLADDMGLPHARPAAASALTESERRILSVIVVAAPTTGDAADAPTVRMDELGPPRAVQDAVAARGGQLRALADGGMAVTLTGSGVATDQAARAASLTLALRELIPERAIALATGRGSVAKRVPAGEVIDRVTALLARSRAPETPGEQRAVDIDHVTAGLLDLRFDVSASAAGFTLRGLREADDAARTLLGRQTIFVGRDREVRAITAIVEDCVAEPAARAALVTAPAGMGKSRLGHEVVSRLAARGDIEVWTARGEPARAGVPFGMIAQLVRHTARLRDGEPAEAREQKIAARAGRHVDTAASRRVAEFLGEMVGVPFPDDASVQLRAARRDPSLMSDQMRRAWLEFVSAECDRSPLCIVLEDLHWGDAPSVGYLGDALRALGERPLFVLALARPEIHDAFPRIWSAHGVTEIRLGPLSRKACERLARSVLGDDLPDETIGRLWSRSEGNAFFLEELVRAVAEGREGDEPETVMAMIEARLDTLDPEDRRLLRAGSIFGEVFWERGVTALLGAAARSTTERLRRLDGLEWITTRSESRFQGDRELCFRHALVREAVYGTLTPEDRALGHRLAGAFLESVGETDAAVIAAHFEQGHEPERAVPWYRRAAVQALESGDTTSAIQRVERALACGAEGETRGDLLVILADALGFRGDHAASGRWAEEALTRIPMGTGRWYAAMRARVSAACLRGDSAQVREATRVLLDMATREPRETRGPREQVTAMASAVGWLFLLGLHEEGERLYAATETLAPQFSEDPAVMGTLDFYARAIRATVEADVLQSFRLMQSAALHFEKAGDLRRLCKAESCAGMMLCDLGGYEEALVYLDRALAVAERLHFPTAMVMARSTRAFALAHLGRLDEARADSTASAGVHCGDRRTEAEAWVYHAWILAAGGDLAGAEEAARKGVTEAERIVTRRPYVIALLAEVLLARGQHEEALARSREATALVDAHPRYETGQSLVRLMLARSLSATGDHDGALRVIAAARDELLAAAARIDDAAWRERFLTCVPENARTLALAERWPDEP